jgi:phage recombination protein Bet
MDNLPAPKGAIDYSNPTMLDTIASTVAVGATAAEFKMFIAFCQSTGLNPFKKEIWFIKPKGQVQMMTGVAGFHAIANGHPQYDGIETGFVGKDGEYLPMTYPKDDYIGAWAKVYRKDRRIPHEGVAMKDEYAKSFGNWTTMPRVMIVKCAESVALRKAFPQQLNGLYTEEEFQEAELAQAHPLDAIQPKATPVSKLPVAKGETQRQAETRLLMAAGDSWVYGSGLIEVEGAERKSLWARLVKDHGAITDDEGNIHTGSETALIGYALIGKPGRNESNGEAA